MKQTIKTMALLLCAVAMVMMISCSKETSYQNRIVGKWQLTKITTLWDGQVYTGPVFASDDRWEPIEFKSNELCIINYYFVPKSNYDQVGGQYRIENDEISIFVGAGRFSWKILELTNSSLVCQDYFQDGDGIKYEFTKVN